LDALAALVSSQLVTADGMPVRFSFAHPLTRAAVYDAIPAAERTDLHLRTARVHAHDPIKAATHLVRVPPGLGSLDPVPVLSEAAEVSLARGSVNGAVAFLRRILEEDLGDRRAGVLTRLGTVESLVDASRGIERLAEALALEPDPDKRAQVSFSLATVLWLTCRPREAARGAGPPPCGNAGPSPPPQAAPAAPAGRRASRRSSVPTAGYGCRACSSFVHQDGPRRQDLHSRHRLPCGCRTLGGGSRPGGQRCCLLSDELRGRHRADRRPSMPARARPTSRRAHRRPDATAQP
jgi:hypothetical protein